MMVQLPIYSVTITFLILYAIVVARYFLVSGALHIGTKNALGSRRKISQGGETRIPGEITDSLISAIFFAAAGTWLIFEFHAGRTLIYTDWQRFGIAYLPFSFLLLLFLHETYFYWTHRWMHRPGVFRLVHQRHHLSKVPTAFASFAFHPLEAALEALILPILVLLVPTHVAVLALFLAIMTLSGTINHVGYEIFPSGFARHPVFRWWITASHHQVHHEQVRFNYGLYFNFWDRWMGTQHPSYEQKFAEVVDGPRNPAAEYDLIIVGGGLSGGLAAFYLKTMRPEWRVLLLESSSRLGGNHTWSFHESDLSESSRVWIKPLVSCRWARHEVRFPSHNRIIESAYASIRSSNFHETVKAALGSSLRVSTEVKALGHEHVLLMDGTKLSATAVLDARGMKTGSAVHTYQKFVGLDLELNRPHGLKHPVLMDATVEQKDGFRFFYLLPWTERGLLVEDTRYSDSPELSEEELRKEILRYCEKNGWKPIRIERKEVGVLPIPLRALHGGRNALGMRAGTFHLTTGYSLPEAVRSAECLGQLRNISAEAVQNVLQRSGYTRLLRTHFFLALNRMLFLAAAPSARVKIFEKFYRLPLPTIQRFYSGRLRFLDAARILSGRPPVPWKKGLKAILHSSGKGDFA